MIIPTFQRRSTVCDAVRAIHAIDFSGRFELIVVVDGSTDGTAAALGAISGPVPTRIIEQNNAGAANARNRGAGAASADILLFLDDDMICRPDILRQLAAAFRPETGPAPDAVYGNIPLDPASPRNLVSDCVGAWARDRDAALSAGVPLALGDLLSGQFAIRKAVFAQLEGFDCDFTAQGRYGNEDLDLGARLLAKYLARYCPDAVSYQRYIVTPAENLQQCRDAARADVLLAAKHPARTAEIFAQHGMARKKTRWLVRPLASVPYVPGLSGKIALWLAAGFYGLHPALDRVLIRIFSLAREINYWSAVK